MIRVDKFNQVSLHNPSEEIIKFTDMQGNK